MSDVDETTGLTKSIKDETNQNEDNVTYAKLSGHQKNLSYKNSEEYITFDFIVTSSNNILSTNDNLKNAIKESVDCELEQIQDLTITEIDDGTTKKQCRVSGKIFTDDWELPMLQKKFQNIISQRVLSGNLQKICEVEDRPMIRRFFCKTSRDLNKKKNGELGKLKTTTSLRTLKDVTTPTDPAIITPTTKAIAKKTESASYSAENKVRNGNDNNVDTQPSPSPHLDDPLKKGGDEGGNSSSDSNSSSGKHSEGDKKDTTMPPRTPDDQCECFCIVL